MGLKRNILFSILYLFIVNFIIGQDKPVTWKEHKIKAEELFSQGKFTKAGREYEKAWIRKKKKLDLIYSAGEAYYLDRNFKRAVIALSHVKEKNKKFDMVGLMYARALKQNEQYSLAKKEFSRFYNNYEGSDKSKLKSLIDREKEGCDLGLLLYGEMNDDLVVVYPRNVNSKETDFGPIAFSDDILYFSSTRNKGHAKIYRSHYKEGQWTSPEMPRGFRRLKKEHFGNGSFTPDDKRMYFTKCEEAGERTGLYTICEIYYVTKRGDEWQDPTKLGTEINIPNYTNTQPCVIHSNNKEFLYFSSNRPGGRGGMDLWYSYRNLNDNNSKFSIPKNLGDVINTAGDEITPFYEVESSTLYFASNGQVNIGGFDIFKSSGLEIDWNEPENLGIPINSSVDDYYFTLAPSRTKGFFVSIRKMRGKPFVRDEDVIEFRVKRSKSLLTGRLEGLNQEIVMDADIFLYEILGQRKRLLSKQKAEKGKYQFVLLPSRKYEVVVQSESYDDYKVSFSTDEFGGVVEDIPRMINLNDVSAIADNKEAIIVEDKEPIIEKVIEKEKIEIPDEDVSAVEKEQVIEKIEEEISVPKVDIVKEQKNEVSEKKPLTKNIISSSVKEEDESKEVIIPRWVITSAEVVGPFFELGIPIHRIMPKGFVPLSFIEEEESISEEILKEEVAETPNVKRDPTGKNYSTLFNYRNVQEAEAKLKSKEVEAKRRQEAIARTMPLQKAGYSAEDTIHYVDGKIVDANELISNKELIADVSNNDVVIEESDIDIKDEAREEKFVLKDDNISESAEQINNESSPFVANDDASSKTVVEEHKQLKTPYWVFYSARPAVFKEIPATSKTDRMISSVISRNGVPVKEGKETEISDAKQKQSLGQKGEERVSYKIQLIATHKIDLNDDRFKKLKQTTSFILEETGNGVTRVYYKAYDTFEEASNDLLFVKKNGFKRAFIVKFVAGERQKHIIRLEDE